MSACADNNDTRQITLVSVLDLCATTPLVAELISARGNSLIIDASNVERIGAQCVQILWSTEKSWSVDEQSLKILNPTPAFETALRDLGVQLQSTSEG